MPTYRSITIALHSQYDIETLPEFFSRPWEDCFDQDTSPVCVPLVDEQTATCSVYIPVFPGSQFWIGYAVSPPVPESQHFLFKLFIDNMHIVSWSTGQEDEWRGKTMFGLYEREVEEGKKIVEKRILCFAPQDQRHNDWMNENAQMEIRVYRAHARQRVERELQDYEKTDLAKRRGGIK